METLSKIVNGAIFFNQVFTQNFYPPGKICRRTVNFLVHIICPAPDGLTKWQNGTHCEDSKTNDKAFIPYPGISSIENHAVFKGGLSVKAQLTKWFWASIGLGLGHEQAHYITFGDTGKDRNQTGQIERFYPTPSEVDAIKKGTLRADEGPYDEINPVYRPYIDLAGRRFRITDTTIFDVMVALKGQF